MSDPISKEHAYRYPEYKRVTIAWLLILVLSPLVGLLWNVHWGWLKANWILYPLFFFTLLHTMRKSRREPKRFLLALVTGIFYIIYFLWNEGEPENVLRATTALVPLLLIMPIREHISEKYFNVFWKTYLLILMVPLFLSLLQIFGVLPYYEADIAYGLYQGRISGGYQKVNNLNAFLFPAYLFGYYLYFSGKRRSGLLLGSFIFLVILVSGLRTSLIAYAAIFICALIPAQATRILSKSFNYGIILLIGVSSFFLLSVMRQHVGLVEGLRQRIPMWEIQAETFFGSPLNDILVGHGKVQLPQSANEYNLFSLNEVHNNDFRMMITFGLVGYLLYGLLLRHVAVRIWASAGSAQFKFLQMASLIYLLMYSVTNEPVFYPAVLWPITAWMIFPLDPIPGTQIRTL